MIDHAPGFAVRRRKAGDWEVLVTPPGFGAPIEMTGFRSENAARKWIERDALAWLAAHKVAA
ncbi:MAG: hypothetical protein AB7M12_00170 [Hyphomonadaceae bacterium]